MNIRIGLRLFASVTLGLIACASSPATPGADFVIHQAITLTRQYEGIEGRLEIVRDQRLKDSDIKGIQERDLDAPLESSSRFKSNPLNMARLLLKSQDGHVQQSIVLDKPVADLKAVDLQNHERVILVTQDFSVGMGSYNGPITQILDIAGSSMSWATACESKTNCKNKKKISLMRSLKTAWNFAPSKNGKSKDILEVSCRPDEFLGPTGQPAFVTRFSRYHKVDGNWVASSRSERKLWEAEDNGHGEMLGYVLPDLKKFPR